LIGDEYGNDRLVGSPHGTNAPYTPFRAHHISLPYQYTAAKCDAPGPTHLTHPFHAAIRSSPASIIVFNTKDAGKKARFRRLNAPGHHSRPGVRH